MTQPQTVILIQGSDILSAWPEAICTTPAVANYYLAQEAARQRTELHYDDVGKFYQIGKNDYDLLAFPILDLHQVNALRRRHEQCSGSPSPANRTRYVSSPSPRKTANQT